MKKYTLNTIRSRKSFFWIQLVIHADSKTAAIAVPIFADLYAVEDINIKTHNIAHICVKIYWTQISDPRYNAQNFVVAFYLHFAFI